MEQIRHGLGRFRRSIHPRRRVRCRCGLGIDGRPDVFPAPRWRGWREDHSLQRGTRQQLEWFFELRRQAPPGGLRDECNLLTQGRGAPMRADSLRSHRKTRRKHRDLDERR